MCSIPGRPPPSPEKPRRFTVLRLESDENRVTNPTKGAQPGQWRHCHGHDFAGALSSLSEEFMMSQLREPSVVMRRKAPIQTEMFLPGAYRHPSLTADHRYLPFSAT